MRRTETTTEKLRYRFTPEEHLKNAEHLAAKFHEAGEMTQTHEAVKAQLAEQKKLIAAEIGKYARLVSDGFDVRDIQCRWDYGRPSTNQKTLVRLDSGDDVRTEMMLDHERQEMLKLELPSHILTGPGALKDKKVNELDDADIHYFASRDEGDLIKFGWIKVDVEAVFEEAKRRAEEKAKPGPVVVEMPKPASTAEVAAESASVSDSGIQFVNEAKASEDASAGCELCDNGVPLIAGGEFHSDPEGSICRVWARNSALATPPEELEAPGTLASAREANGATPHATGGRKRRTTAQKPLTDEERNQLEQVQAEAQVGDALFGAEPEDF